MDSSLTVESVINGLDISLNNSCSLLISQRKTLSTYSLTYSVTLGIFGSSHFSFKIIQTFVVSVNLMTLFK